MNNPIPDPIQEATARLIKIFPADQDQITFIDERGDGHHFKLELISDAFQDRPQIERQRMIYDELKDLIQTNSIHALRMDLKTHEENNGKEKITETSEASFTRRSSSEDGQQTLNKPQKRTKNPQHDHLTSLTTQHPIMVFMKGDRFLPQCGFSARIIDLLDGIEVEYETFDILEDEEVRQGLKEFSNWPTYPQLYINGDLIGGLDIAEELLEKGELQKLLNNL